MISSYSDSECGETETIYFEVFMGELTFLTFNLSSNFGVCKRQFFLCTFNLDTK